MLSRLINLRGMLKELVNKAIDANRNNFSGVSYGNKVV